MVLTNGAKNCGNTIKSRPPLVVFTVCLLGIIVTTFSLAYYVQNQDNIPNTDAKEDWISLLKHFNTYDICVENTTGPIFKENTNELLERASISSKVKLSKFISNNGELNIEGLVPLQGWTSRCPDKTLVPSHLQISLTFPVLETNSTQDVCVTLTGPIDFMPKFVDANACGPVLKPTNQKWGKLTTKSSMDKEPVFCTGGSLGKLQYDIDYNKNLKLDMFLSQEDRLTINSHLIATSCFLVFIVILITCYALIKSKFNATGDSKQLLTPKGMYI